MIYDEIDIAWLAGLLEGEGCFGWRDQRRMRYGFPEIALAMTDVDVVMKAARLMGSKRTTSYQPKGNRKRMYACRVFSTQAADVMESILPYMGVRRSAKVKEVLELWNNRPGRVGRWDPERSVRGTKVGRWQKRDETPCASS